MTSTSTPSTVARPPYNMDKPPYLEGRAPQDFETYINRLDFYFIHKELTTKKDSLKIMYAGNGLGYDSELSAWWNGGKAGFVATTWDVFIRALLSRGLPKDFVWDVLKKIRKEKQGDTNWVDYSLKMRGYQTAVGTNVVSDLDLVREMLFNMDEGLCRFLRAHNVLKKSGLHEADMDALGFSRVSTALTSFAVPVIPKPGKKKKPTIDAASDEEPVKEEEENSVDFLLFDKIARERWIVITAQKETIYRQVSSGLKNQSKSSSTPFSKPSKPSSSTATSSTVASPPVLNRTPKLSPRDRAWLKANNGCYSCRRIDIDHQSPTCPENGKGLPPAQLVIPDDWKIDDPVPKSNNATATNPSKLAPLQMFDESDAESAEFSPESESDECVDVFFPTLLTRISGPLKICDVEALADSGASTSVITDELVKELGLEKVKLAKPSVVTLALKGKNETVFRITHYVHANLSLASGLWTPDRPTFFKVVDKLDVGCEIILGCPFLKRHSISIHLAPYPQLRLHTSGSQFLDILAPVFGPRTFRESFSSLSDLQQSEFRRLEVERRIEELVTIAAIRKEEEKELKEAELELARLQDLDRLVRNEFPNLFPSVLPHVKENLSKTRHHIKLKDPNKVHNRPSFRTPTRHLAAWKRLIDAHVLSGRLRRSDSPFASPSFIIPKKDPLADPRMVNDYRGLNANTEPDRTNLPLTSEILEAIAHAAIWGKIDMTDAFYQTMMNEDDISKTAIKTPWGLYEWVVMPQGLCNAPATHQRRVNEALGSLIGDICYVYLDDVIIFSNSEEEHLVNCRRVLKALEVAGLFLSKKKTDLFTKRTTFLGHIISTNGLEIDPDKVKKVVNWTTPRTVKQLRGFLGLVQYMRKFCDGLAKETAILTPLIKKNVVSITTDWLAEHETAFRAIKMMLTSAPILRPVNSLSDEQIWVMTDASNLGVGAVLLQGHTFDTARPCAYYSRQLNPAEKNYPVHELEQLAIVCALKEWRVHLIGLPIKFKVKTDHHSLKYWSTQPTLSRRQARWMEVFADFDFDIEFIKGELNLVADSLSRFSFPKTPSSSSTRIAGISSSKFAKPFLDQIKAGYTNDSFCVQALKNLKSLKDWKLEGGLLYFQDRLVIPADPALRRLILHDFHDSLGHFGSRKSFNAIAPSFYWPTLRKDTLAYVHSCDTCQRHKSRTSSPLGLLHPLPIPTQLFKDIAIDFVGPLPISNNFNMLLTITCRLSGYVRLLPCLTTDSAKKCAERMFEGYHRLFGFPDRIVSDRDKLFVSELWRAHYRRFGVQLQRSTGFHPETDGKSERTNKTAIQVLRMMTTRNQKDWESKLGMVEYVMNSATNDATGKSPFELVLGYTPSLTPVTPKLPSDPTSIQELVDERKAMLDEARDTLGAAKVRQAEQANAKRREEPELGIGDLVMIDSKDRRLRYKSGTDSRAAKLFPRHDGPYKISNSWPEQSLYELDLGPNDLSFPKFHISKLKPYIPNDPILFPNRATPPPPPIVINNEEEWKISEILDQKVVRKKKKFLIRWEGYPDPGYPDSWEGAEEFEDTEALDRWELKQKEQEN